MESVLKSVLIDELDRNRRKQSLFCSELNKYKKGSLVILVVHGDKYVYRKSREGKKIISEYIGPFNGEKHLDAIKDRERYIKLKQDIKDLKQEEISIKRAIKAYD